MPTPHIYGCSFINPVHQDDRLFTKIIRRGMHSVTVTIPNGTRIRVPKNFFHNWLRVGSIEYNNWLEKKLYAQGRTINDITFGVELEFIGNSSKLETFKEAMNQAVGYDKFSAPLCYNIHSTTKWLLKTDSSVGSIQEGDDYTGFELTSPILKFNKECKKELNTILHLITTVFEGKINNSCGTHIHIGNFARIQYTTEFNSKVRDFQKNYGYYEDSVFDKLISPSRRGSKNKYCKSCNDVIPNTTPKRDYKINICNIYGLGTLENRQLQGTLDLNKIWYWVELNGRYMVDFFRNPGKFIFNKNEPYTLNSFFDKIDLSTEAREFLIKGLVEDHSTKIEFLNSGISYKQNVLNI